MLNKINLGLCLGIMLFLVQSVYASSDIGKNVTTRKSEGDVYFRNSITNMKATKVTLGSGTHVEQGAILQINKQE